MQQQGDVAKACQVLHTSSSSNTPTYPQDSRRLPSLGDSMLDWSKGDGNGMDSLYGSMQSEFTNLDLDQGTGESPHSSHIAALNKHCPHDSLVGRVSVGVLA